jgi:prophage DNA circulation protein
MATKRSDLDVLARLSEASWRGITFYHGQMSFGFEQQHVQHLYPDRDAGFIESTGRNPATYTFAVLFRNGIAGWKDTPYPTVWRKFVAACADRTRGVLVHPEFGDLNVKCKTCRTTWDPARRDGVDVEVEFVEASDEENELATALGKIGTVALSTARSIDDALGNVSPVPELPDTLKPSLLDSLKKLKGSLDQFKQGIGNIGAQIDSVLGGISDLTDTISALDDPKNYPLIDALQRLFGDVVDLASTSTRKGKPVTLAQSSQTADVSTVAAFFGMSVEDFLRLNPSLASRTSVAAGTDVLVLV